MYYYCIIEGIVGSDSSVITVLQITVKVQFFLKNLIFFLSEFVRILVFKEKNCGFSMKKLSKFWF